MRARSLLALPLLLPALLGAASAEPAERAVVQLAHPPGPWERAALAARGLHTLVQVIPAAVGDVTPGQRAWLEAQPWVVRVERDQPLVRHLDLSARLIRAGPPVLSLGADGQGVTIAVLDSGIDATHPDFQGRVRANMVYAGGGWVPGNGDTEGHGTHVAGIAAGSGAASEGVLRGVAPGASLVGMDFSRAFTTSTALLAFDWVLRNAAAHNIRVVTNSWGRAETPNRWDPGDSLVRASNRLVNEGIVVIFSAGNHGPGASTLSLEAQNPAVITVGAVDDAAVPARFSGRGPVLSDGGEPMPWVKPDVVADGVDVYSARSAQSAGPVEQPVLSPSQLPVVGGGLGPAALRYLALSGTSQAAPHVAGIVALMLEADPALTPGQVHNLLRETAIDLADPGPDPLTGFGLVDARDAVLRALGRDGDQGNILLAGGEETYLGEGSLTSAAGQLVQTAPVLRVQERGTVEVPVPVKPGATAVRFDFGWAPVSAGFRVYLVGPTQTLGPWTASRVQDGERVVSGRIEDPLPGVYSLLARPSAPTQVDFRASAVVTVREQARLPADLEQRYRAPEVVGPVEQVAQELEFEVDRVRSEWRRAVPGPDASALAAVALAALAWGARRRHA